MRNLSVLLLASLLFTTPAHADDGIWRTLFPSLFVDNYDPYKTMKAPFAEGAQDAEEVKLQTLEDLEQNIPKAGEVVAITLPHTTTDDIKKWVVTAISDSLSFNAGQLQQEAKKSLEYFTKAGQQQYIDFLKESGIAQQLKSGQLRVNSVAKTEPLLISERTFDGRYRWLFEVPVIISYLDGSSETYENAIPVNKTTVLTVQVTRSLPAESLHHDVLIELWNGNVRKAES